MSRETGLEIGDWDELILFRVNYYLSMFGVGSKFIWERHLRALLEDKRMEMKVQQQQ
jgi:hypothetical protein